MKAKLPYLSDSFHLRHVLADNFMPNSAQKHIGKGQMVLQEPRKACIQGSKPDATVARGGGGGVGSRAPHVMVGTLQYIHGKPS